MSANNLPYSFPKEELASPDHPPAFPTPAPSFSPSFSPLTYPSVPVDYDWQTWSWPHYDPAAFYSQHYYHFFDPAAYSMSYCPSKTYSPPTEPSPAPCFSDPSPAPSFPDLPPTDRPFGKGTNHVRARTETSYRTVYSDYQRNELEKEYLSTPFIAAEQKGEIAQRLQLTERQVKIWFQNRRAKERRDTGRPY